MFVWWVLGDRQPRYMMGSLIYLLPLVAWMIGQSEGWARRGYRLIAVLTVLPMLLIIFSKQGIEFADRIIFSKQLTRNAFYEYPVEVDHLPEGSTLVNLVGRTWNFPLFGEHYRNRLVNFMAALRAFHAESHDDEPPKLVVLKYPILREMHATHIMSLSSTKLEIDDCIELNEIGRLDRNPINKRKHYQAHGFYMK